MKRTPKSIAILITLLWAIHAAAGSVHLYTADRLSSGLITCICQDRYGFIWIGTEYGLNKFDGYRYTSYHHNRADSTSLVDNEIASLFVDSKGQLWVGCSRGLARYDYEHDRFQRFRFPDDRTPRVNSMEESRSRSLLIGTAGYGLFTIREGETYMHYENAFNARHMDDFYSRMHVDREGNLWRSSHINTFTKYTVKDDKLTGLRDYQSAYGQPTKFLEFSRQELYIVCMYGILSYHYATGEVADAGYNLSQLDRNVSIEDAAIDHEGNIYLCMSGSGLMIIAKGERTPRRIVNANSSVDLSTCNIVDVMEDKDRNLWLGCYNKGLLMLSQHEQAFSSWSFSKQQWVTGSGVSSMAKGDHGDLWCTVQNSGVYHVDADGCIIGHPQSPMGTRLIYRDHEDRFWLCTESVLYRYNPVSGQATAEQTFCGRGLNCMTDDGQGRLYISAFGMGLFVYDTRSRSMEHISMAQTNRSEGYLCNDWIKALTFDSQGMLWICTTSGTARMNPEGYVFNSRKWNSILKEKQCYSACETADGNMLIGTESGLYLYNNKKNTVEEVPHSESLQDKMLCSMVRDQQGNIWLSTTTGIWQYDRKRQQFTGYIGGNGLDSKEYIIGAALHLDNDRIYFGTADGITTFLPKDVDVKDERMGQVYLTKFTAGGKSLNPMQERFELPFKDNTFTLEFSLLDYKDPENISFQYRVNGSSTWMQTGEGNNQITFNEMQPGTYTIEVRAANNDVYSEPVYKLHVVVMKPWYKSTLAYLVYAAIAGGFLFLLLFNFERQRRRDLEETKMRFLINATHDIRSPLTLIMGALEKTQKHPSSQASELQLSLDTIDKNAKRLLLLVNQILDERKIDKHQMKLSCAETDLMQFVNGIFKLYEYHAQQHNIAYTMQVEENPGKVWIDRINFDKVISNLIGNAFKYTPDGGEITIRLTRNNKDNRAVIQVVDSGIGFEDDKTERFFERFYQGKNSKDLHLDGTGIGLNLSRALTEMHGGRISATNRKDGHTGAILTVELRYGKDHLKLAEIDEQPQELTTDNPQQPTVKKQGSRNFKILLVDDDREIARYIRNELGSWYKFKYAPNGREALKLLLTQPFDLVISDVMMPEMDGISLLRSIKSNSNISDVPVILLTSKSEVQYRLEGLKKGADAFLAKPFSMEELHVLIDNIVDNVRRLRGKFTGAQVQRGKVKDVEVKGNDDLLMEKVMRCVNQNLGNPDFDIDMLTRDVGISRAQLHRKMKEMTGISTSEFIRNLRLEQAARLIREKKINITQVAYSVGFNNQTHFSTVFKKHFGMTPTEYAESNEEQITPI